MRILVVEDHQLARNTIAMMLQSRGHTVVQAEGMKDAFSKISNVVEYGSFDRVLTDLQMPTCGGFEVIRMAKKICSPSTVIVLMSGQLTDSDIILAETFGASATIAKPFSLQELLTALQL